MRTDENFYTTSAEGTAILDELLIADEEGWGLFVLSEDAHQTLNCPGNEFYYRAMALEKAAKGSNLKVLGKSDVKVFTAPEKEE